MRAQFSSSKIDCQTDAYDANHKPIEIDWIYSIIKFELIIKS
jgi:hypothetical protein